MKKLLVFLLLSLPLPEFSQPYQRMLADSVTSFRVVPLFIPVMNRAQSANCISAWIGTWDAEGDSVYKTKTYKRFYLANAFNGLLREDTNSRKVFFIPYCDTSETLLYDFSLTTGATISYTFTQAATYDGVFAVDSIRYKHDYLSHYRRHFYLRNHAIGSPTFEIIEGIGHVNHPLFLYYDFQPGILGWSAGSQTCPASQFSEVLSCKWDDGKKIFYDSCAYDLAAANNCVGVSDTCQYQTICGGINEFSELKNVRTFPNPANNGLTVEIEADHAIKVSLAVVDIMGIEIIKASKHECVKGLNRVHISVAGLPAGVFLLRVEGGQALSLPLVIAR